MGKNSMLKGLDAFGKVQSDVKVKTGLGAILTLCSFVLIVTLTVIEFVDYRRITLHPSILVDKSRGEKLVVNMNITFPRVPCYLLSVDIMDISGEHQNDVNHDILKTRISDKGVPVAAPGKRELQGELDRIAKVRGPDYCGSCYGGTPPASGCCNTCEEVRESYVRRGWSFVNPDSIEQCVQEGFSEKLREQATEGCNIAGKVRVNKVIGNFHLSPGRSFQSNAMHVHDLVPYLQGEHHHDFGHVVHRFNFGSEEEHLGTAAAETERLKGSLGIIDPLNGIKAHTEESNYMFQYFLKVVSTRFETLSQQTLQTHQYSVTSYERDLSKGNGATQEAGHSTSHGFAGVPGVFFSYEISPMLVIHRETRQSIAHFLTSTCAIVGGILTVAGIIDSLIYNGRNKLATGAADGQHGLAYTREGKWL